MNNGILYFGCFLIFIFIFFLTDDNEETEISEETGEYIIFYAKTFNFEKDETNWKGS